MGDAPGLVVPRVAVLGVVVPGVVVLEPYCLEIEKKVVHIYLSLLINRMGVTYKGRASHAAAAPWMGINALDAVVLAYTNISCLRQQLKPAYRVQGETGGYQ